MSNFYHHFQTNAANYSQHIFSFVHEKMLPIINFRNVPSYTCFLDGNGEVLDYLRLSYINKKISVSSDVERVQKVSLVVMYSHVVV